VEPSFAGQTSFLTEGGKYRGVGAWIFTTDHKRIGLLYLVSILTFFVVGVFLGLLMRFELIAPGRTIMSAQSYNAVFTLHGVIMIFFFVIPGIPAAFGNFFLPLLIGARDVAFPRINLLSWWLYMTGASLAILSLFTGGGPPDTGWTFYAPYSIKTGTNVSLAVFAAFVLGFSSILTGLNFVTTIHRMRAPGMTWFRMPLFVWSLYATAWVQILATPVLAITLVLLIFERFFSVGFFDPTKGGDPLLFQHLFWIYSHPAVYIMILPAMGVISEIIPVFARRTIFGYKMIVFSSLAIALTFLVAIPSGIKVFNWVASLYKGSIRVESPFLYCLVFVFLFSIGGLTGLINGALATNVHIHDTYFVVGHFHYVMFGGTAIGFFAALHYWFPKMFGRMYSEKTARVGCVIIFIGFNLLYFPMFSMGWEGMPRRYYDYLPVFHAKQFVSTLGSWILAGGLAVLFSNLIRAFFRGEPVGSNPWGASTLDPTVTGGPYHFEAALEEAPGEAAESGGGDGENDKL
jgi:cytochrome c oxidase subunit 1